MKIMLCVILSGETLCHEQLAPGCHLEYSRTTLNKGMYDVIVFRDSLSMSIENNDGKAESFVVSLRHFSDKTAMILKSAAIAPYSVLTILLSVSAGIQKCSRILPVYFWAVCST